MKMTAKYPTLSKVAKKFLGVPATSAPVEHVFSHGGNTLRPDRLRLTPKTLRNFFF